MKRLIIISLSIWLFSCNNQSAIIQSVERLIEESEITQEKLETRINRTIDEHGVKSDSMLIVRDSIINITTELKLKISTATSQVMIASIIDEWNLRIQHVFKTKEITRINENLDFKLEQMFTLLELNNRTNRILREVNIHARPQTGYSFLKLYIEPEEHDMQLGQQLKGKVYLVATSSYTPNIVSITVNEKQVEFDNEGVGLFELVPTRRGEFLLRAKATGLPGLMYNSLDLENSTFVNVK